MRAWIWSAVACGQRGAAAGLAELGVDDAVRLAGAVAPGADQAVELLAQGGELLAGHQGGGRGLGGTGCFGSGRRAGIAGAC